MWNVIDCLYMSLHMHFRWGVTLVGKLSIDIAHPVWGIIFQARRGKKLVVELVCEIGLIVAFFNYFTIFWIEIPV